MFQEQPTTILHSRISYEQLLQVHFSTRATAESGGILQSLYCNRERNYESGREGPH